MKKSHEKTKGAIETLLRSGMNRTEVANLLGVSRQFTYNLVPEKIKGETPKTHNSGGSLSTLSIYKRWSALKHRGELSNDWTDFNRFLSDLQAIDPGIVQGAESGVVVLSRLDTTKAFGRNNIIIRRR